MSLVGYRGIGYAGTGLWDIVWDKNINSGDWHIVTKEDFEPPHEPYDEEEGEFPPEVPPDTESVEQTYEGLGDFQAIDPLGTAIILLLFTDKPLPNDKSIESRRATWHGNSFDNENEGQLGSLLWTLSRATVTDQLELQARAMVAQALQTLVDQGLVKGFLIDVQVARPYGSTDVWLTIFVVALTEREISFTFQYPVA